MASDHRELKQLAEHLGASKQQHENTSSHASIDVSSMITDTDDKLYKKSNLAQAFEASKSSNAIELNVEKATGNSLLGESNVDYSTSILEKLFGGALTLNGGSSSSPHEVIIVSRYIFVLCCLYSLSFSLSILLFLFTCVHFFFLIFCFVEIYQNQKYEFLLLPHYCYNCSFTRRIF